MNNYSIDEVFNIYEQSGIAIYNATMSGDHKTNNREGRYLLKFFKYFENNEEFGHLCIDKLFESSNVVVKIKAASYCLALGYKTEYAVSVLEAIANNPENGIFRFNAEMTLKVWKEKGCLRL